MQSPSDLSTDEHLAPQLDIGRPITQARLRRHQLPKPAIRLMQFALVGGIGYLVNLLVFAILHQGLHTPYIAASIAAFLISVCGNYGFNRAWTFRDRRGHPLQQGLKSVGLATVTFLIQLGLLRLLVETAGLAPLTGQAIAVAACLPINFVLQRFLVFS